MRNLLNWHKNLLKHGNAFSKISWFIRVNSFKFCEVDKAELQRDQSEYAAEVVNVRDANWHVNLLRVNFTQAISNYNGIGITGSDFVKSKTHFLEAVVFHNEKNN